MLWPPFMNIAIEEAGRRYPLTLQDGSFTLGGSTRDALRISSLPQALLRVSVRQDLLCVEGRRPLIVRGLRLKPHVPRAMAPGEWLRLSSRLKLWRCLEPQRFEGSDQSRVCLRALAEEAPFPLHPCVARLFCVVGPELGHSWVLRDGELRLGRDAQAEIRLRDPAISRSHACLRVLPTGTQWVDAGSSQGTWRNGRRLAKPQDLQHGDLMGLGRSLLRYEWPGSPEPATKRHDQRLWGWGLGLAAAGLALSMSQVA